MNNQLKEILTELVRIPSVTGDIPEAQNVMQAVKKMLAKSGATTTTGSIKKFPYLTATTQPANKDMIWFIAHLDVVPADKSLFAVREDEQNLYGRGVFDMKGMAAAILTAFLQHKPGDAKNVGLMFTTDEEIGGRNGVGALAGSGFAGSAAFVFDQSADWVLQEKMKGVLWIEAKASGKAAHGARPWLGKNANSALVAYLSDLQSWYEAHMQQADPDNYYTTLNLGTVHGGEATNQVSGEAVATLDIRFTNETDAQTMLAAAQRLAKKQGNITIRKLLHDPCVITDPSDGWYQRTAVCMNDLGIQPGKNGERFGHGSTDGRYLAPHDISVVTVRPPGGGQHSPAEWASKRGLEELTLLCARLMQAAQ